MKKIFSIVVLAGILMLMSFSFKAEKKQETWCETVDRVCLDAAAESVNDFGYTLDEGVDYWDECNAINGCD